MYPQVARGEVVRLILPWMPQFGLELNFRLDGYAWLFAMLVALMGVLVVLYARYYMSSADPVPRFFLVPPRVHGRHARHRCSRAT